MRVFGLENEKNIDDFELHDHQGYETEDVCNSYYYVYFSIIFFWVSLKQTERGRLGNKLLLKMPTWLGRPLAIGSLSQAGARATAKDNFTIGPNKTIVLHVWHTFFNQN